MKDLGTNEIIYIFLVLYDIKSLRFINHFMVYKKA